MVVGVHVERLISELDERTKAEALLAVQVAKLQTELKLVRAAAEESKHALSREVKRAQAEGERSLHEVEREAEALRQNSPPPQPPMSLRAQLLSEAKQKQDRGKWYTR